MELYTNAMSVHDAFDAGDNLFMKQVGLLDKYFASQQVTNPLLMSIQMKTTQNLTDLIFNEDFKVPDNQLRELMDIFSIASG